MEKGLTDCVIFKTQMVDIYVYMVTLNTETCYSSPIVKQFNIAILMKFKHHNQMTSPYIGLQGAVLK